MLVMFHFVSFVTHNAIQLPAEIGAVRFPPPPEESDAAALWSASSLTSSALTDQLPKVQFLY